MDNLSKEWVDFITPFADAIGSDVEKVTTALGPLIGDPGQEAIDLLSDEQFTPYDEIEKLVGDGVAKAVLLKAVAGLRKAPEVASTDSAVAAFSADVLPPVPEDDSWLAALKAGGELKVDKNAVISALRAGLANRTGLYDLPKRLAKMMEDHAESLNEPVGDDFYKMRNMLTQREYAEVLSAVGVKGNFVTQGRRDKFLVKLDDHLWPELMSFNSQLAAWMDTWTKTAGNPAMMFSAFASLAGGSGMSAPTMQPPDSGALRDAADGVIEQINQVFAGFGIPVARALGYDAHKIGEVLKDPKLPVQVGATNREQMLKMLGTNVSADYVRMERNITRFALGIMEYPNVTDGQEELMYLNALFQLGASIPWDRVRI